MKLFSNEIVFEGTRTRFVIRFSMRSLTHVLNKTNTADAVSRSWEGKSALYITGEINNQCKD